MIGEGEPLQTDGPSKVEQAKEAVQTATEDVKTTSRAVRDVIDAGRRPGAPLDRLAEWTREAPPCFGRRISLWDGSWPT
jgi:hypothetical protein